MDPLLRKAYIRGAIIGFTITLVVTGILIVSGVLTIGGGDEEERPPVVVSNGSVILNVPDESRDPSKKPIKANKKGQFRSVKGATVYRHTGNDESKDGSVNSLELYFNGATGCSSHFTRELTITTTMGKVVVDRKERGSSGKFDMQVTFPTNAVKPNNHRLELGDHKLVSVTFVPILTSPGIPDPKTCTFDAAEANQWVQIWAR